MSAVVTEKGGKVAQFIYLQVPTLVAFCSSGISSALFSHRKVRSNKMPVDAQYNAGSLIEHPEEATHPVREKLSEKHHAEHDRRMSAPLESELGGQKDVHHLDEKHAHPSNIGGELDTDNEGYPSDGELHGESALRRISAPIPLAVYTVAFVELCERFSYYGTQVVCK